MTPAEIAALEKRMLADASLYEAVARAVYRVRYRRQHAAQNKATPDERFIAYLKSTAGSVVEPIDAVRAAKLQVRTAFYFTKQYCSDGYLEAATFLPGGKPKGYRVTDKFRREFMPEPEVIDL